MQSVRLTFLLVSSLTVAACVGSRQELVFLTRDGCVEANEMRQHLDAAIVKAGWPGDYQVINLASLAKDDPRAGYPTPTVLYQGRDLYDMVPPAPPLPEPT